MRIIDYTQSNEPPRYIKEPGTKYHVKPDDLVMIRYGSPGMPCRGFNGVIANNLFRIIPYCSDSIYLSFAFYFFSSPYFQSFCQSKGVALSAISFTTINDVLLPLPPLTEQKRIVAEIERWFALIDDLEQSKTYLQEYIKQTKSKILSLAISGKLVPQDPNDEPATELLKRINPSFKPCDTSHYENIPNTWQVATIKDISKTVASKNYQILQSEIQAEGEYPVISQSVNYIEGYCNKADKVYHNEQPIIIFGDHTRVVKYVDFDFIVGADGVKIISPLINAKYLYYLTLYASDNIKNRGYGRHFGYLSQFELLIPPLAEQARIATRVDYFIAMIQEITADL